MTIVAEEEVLAAAELDLAAGELVDQLVGPSEPGPTSPPQPPFLVVEKGNPTDAELAALVCVFAAAAAAPAPQVRQPIDNWGLPATMHRGVSPFVPYAYPFVSRVRPPV